MKELITVFRTTLLDQSRDRRSMGAAFLYAMVGPLVMLMAFTAMGDRQEDGKTLRVAVYGAEHASGLVSDLARSGISIERRSGQPRVREGKGGDLAGADTALVVPSDFDRRMSEEQPARLIVIRDEGSGGSAAAARRLEELLEEKEKQAVLKRLGAHGVAPAAAEAFEVEAVNISPTTSSGKMAISMLLYFIILAPFFTSMTAAIDATAGERERQSLKPLLAQPLSPASLIGGKWLVSALFGLLGTIVTVFLGMFLLRFAPLEELGINLQGSLQNQLLIVLLLAPLALAVAAAQSLVALLAKSFKEAQTYIQLLTFAPVALLFMTAFSDEESKGPSAYLPLTGQSDLLQTLLAEGRLELAQAAIVTVLTLAATLLCLVVSERQLHNERLLSHA